MLKKSYTIFLSKNVYKAIVQFSLFSIAKSDDTSQIHFSAIHDLHDKRHFFKIQDKLYQWKILFNSGHSKQPQDFMFSRKNVENAGNHFSLVMPVLHSTSYE